MISCFGRWKQTEAMIVITPEARRRRSRADHMKIRRARGWSLIELEGWDMVFREGCGRCQRAWWLDVVVVRKRVLAAGARWWGCGGGGQRLVSVVRERQRDQENRKVRRPDRVRLLHVS